MRKLKLKEPNCAHQTTKWGLSTKDNDQDKTSYSNLYGFRNTVLMSKSAY